MTYFELLSKANRLLDKGEITIGQRDEMTKPLWDEIRPKGEWLLLRTNYDDGSNNFYECSNCHHSDVHSGSVEVPYCWHCGADMRGGDKE